MTCSSKRNNLEFEVLFDYILDRFIKNYGWLTSTMLKSRVGHWFWGAIGPWTKPRSVLCQGLRWTVDNGGLILMPFLFQIIIAMNKFYIKLPFKKSSFGSLF